MPSMNNAQHLSYGSYKTEVTSSGNVKRKSGGFSGLIRRLLGKEKKTKSQKQTSLPPISKPTSFHHVSGTSARLLGPSIVERQQKAVSLPQDVARSGAIGTYSSYNAILPAHEGEICPIRRPLHRRATLPHLVDSNDEFPYTSKRQSVLDDGQLVDPSEIGFAVTSGANFLKRRSRSVSALYGTAQAQKEIIPTLMRSDRRRSDEIRYWRTSVCPGPAKDMSLEDKEVQDTKHQGVETTEVYSGPLLQPISSAQDESVHVPEHRDSVAASNFDFGVLANEEQESITIEERVINMEVKVMDLEYAVSKLQSISTSDTSFQSQSDAVATNGSLAPSHRSQLRSDSDTSNSVSTQPTTTSVFATEKELAPAINMVQQQHQQQQPSQRSSLNGITIDHLNSLLGLIRREQASRHRLEDQIVELQRDLKSLRQQWMPPAPPVLSSSPYSNRSVRQGGERGWSHGSHQQPRMIRSNTHPSQFDDSETDDDDVFGDDVEVFGTPTEAIRGHFETGVFIHGREGAAF